ncbi:hypothetical protein D3C86_1857090 [compost metagenome]
MSGRRNHYVLLISDEPHKVTPGQETRGLYPVCVRPNPRVPPYRNQTNNAIARSQNPYYNHVRLLPFAISPNLNYQAWFVQVGKILY